MEEIRLKRNNLEELGNALKQLLGNSPFRFSCHESRRFSNSAPFQEKSFEQSTLFGDNPICWWIREQNDPHRKSTVRIAIKFSNGKSRVLNIHPSVRFGGNRYDDNGHDTWFKVQPEQVEISDGHAGFHYTFQAT